jgi:hypothetical protein
VNIDLSPYENRCKVLAMDTLKKRRDVARVLLIFDLLSGKIDSSYLLSQICLSVPSYLTRSREMLHVEFHRTNNGVFEPINAAIKGFNEHADLFEFGLTRNIFLNRLRTQS